MERTYLDSWKQWLLEAAEWRDGNISIKIGVDSKDPDYHNIWISNKKTKTTYVWMVYADPDGIVGPKRIDVESIDESTKKMTYRYKIPITGFTDYKTSKINDTDWNKVKNNYNAGGKIVFDKAAKANYVVYLQFKKSFKY